MARLIDSLFTLPGMAALMIVAHMVPALALVPLSGWFTPMGAALALIGAAAFPLARMAWAETIS